MKISQLFLCWTFTRLHVTKYPAFCLVPSLLHPILYLTLLSTKRVRRKWLDSHGPSLPPKIGWPWPWPWDLVGEKEKTTLCLWKRTHMEAAAAVSPGSARNWPLHVPGAPRHVCSFLPPLWPQGLCSPVGLSADTFQQVFSFRESFLTHVLGQMRTLSRMSLPSESVCCFVRPRTVCCHDSV